MLRLKVTDQGNRGLSTLRIPFNLRDRHIQAAPQSWELRNDSASVHASHIPGTEACDAVEGALTL